MSIIQVPLALSHHLSISPFPSFTLSVSTSHSQDLKAGVAAQQIFAAGHEICRVLKEVEKGLWGNCCQSCIRVALHRVALAGP